MALQQKMVTVEVYEAFINRPENSDKRFELINGAIEELSPTEYHGLLTTNISALLWAYNKKHKLGRVTVETRHRMPDDDHNARIPDISFTRNERLQDVVKEGAVPQMPDLAVEVQSPNDSLKKLREKADYYLNNGSSLVWIVLMDEQVHVYSKDDKDAIVKTVVASDGNLDGGNIIAGFTLSVEDIFDV